MREITSVLLIGDENPNYLAASYGRAFAARGLTVSFWDPQREIAKVSRGGRVGRLAARFAHVEAWIRKANAGLLECLWASPPSLIVVVTTHGLRPGTLAQIRVICPDTRIYCVYPDSPHNLDSDRLACLPMFDRVATSSPGWVESFRSLGATAVNYLPFAADPTLHSPVSPADAHPEYSHDITFVGNWRPEREAFLERFIDFDLKIWGEAYWKTRTRAHSPLRSRWGGRPLLGGDFALACAQSKIMLNVMDSVTWPGPNMRCFELPACGAFALCQRTPAISDLFQNRVNIAFFDSVEEAVERAEFYLVHHDERRSIAARAYADVVKCGHTYADRVEEILGWLQIDSSERAT